MSNSNVNFSLSANNLATMAAAYLHTTVGVRLGHSLNSKSIFGPDKRAAALYGDEGLPDPYLEFVKPNAKKFSDRRKIVTRIGIVEASRGDTNFSFTGMVHDVAFHMLGLVGMGYFMSSVLSCLAAQNRHKEVSTGLAALINVITARTWEQIYEDGALAGYSKVAAEAFAALLPRERNPIVLVDCFQDMTGHTLTKEEQSLLFYVSDLIAHIKTVERYGYVPKDADRLQVAICGCFRRLGQGVFNPQDEGYESFIEDEDVEEVSSTLWSLLLEQQTDAYSVCPKWMADQLFRAAEAHFTLGEIAKQRSAHDSEGAFVPAGVDDEAGDIPYLDIHAGSMDHPEWQAGFGAFQTVELLLNEDGTPKGLKRLPPKQILTLAAERFPRGLWLTSSGEDGNLTEIRIFVKFQSVLGLGAFTETGVSTHMGRVMVELLQGVSMHSKHRPSGWDGTIRHRLAVFSGLVQEFVSRGVLKRYGKSGNLLASKIITSHGPEVERRLFIEKGEEYSMPVVLVNPDDGLFQMGLKGGDIVKVGRSPMVSGIFCVVIPSTLVEVGHCLMNPLDWHLGNRGDSDGDGCTLELVNSY